eukprot:CAMPEP_0197540698 /NCGR_PEP_ID=MMETSP1318-20131121/66742_1 /TAXON_ID=552666 /ORGANISM="Partenskyella glossopodia, Strain RCC365" /LENGTH=41 /DNA_ID= /DNA_START= /DNA_END= /DNA_ORIENTATION=
MINANNARKSVRIPGLSLRLPNNTLEAILPLYTGAAIGSMS